MQSRRGLSRTNNFDPIKNVSHDTTEPHKRGPDSQGTEKKAKEDKTIEDSASLAIFVDEAELLGCHICCTTKREMQRLNNMESIMEHTKLWCWHCGTD
eukprot:5130806-Pleurochrysis_carterae.AAC.5